ncbi:unnamed protein product [Symbiodinium natans]|uniref:Uncharacterized protein n=1 Tax=Symbiodinium natans TaxID=878477 RepID=A0A812PCP8_9DINO|nr:unnamed protein product [Symbiodinium natans]
MCLKDVRIFPRYAEKLLTGHPFLATEAAAVRKESAAKVFLTCLVSLWRRFYDTHKSMKGSTVEVAAAEAEAIANLADAAARKRDVPRPPEAPPPRPQPPDAPPPSKRKVQAPGASGTADQQRGKAQRR